MSKHHKFLVFMGVGLLLLTAPPALGKTVTEQPGKTTAETSVIGVAGPAPRKASGLADKSSAHPSKKALRKAKITPPPSMHDPN
jgi:hypothetical protein